MTDAAPPVDSDPCAPAAGRAVDALRSPHRTHVLVCTDPWRDGCASKGSHAIAARLRRELRDHGLRMEVRTTNTYCQGWCVLSPNLIVEPHGVWYERVSPADVPEIIEEHLLRGRAVTRLLREDYHIAQPGKLPSAGSVAVSPGGADGFPRTLIDGLGRQVTIAHRPLRVGAVSSGAEAIVRALLPTDVIVDAAQILNAPAGNDGAALLMADHDVDTGTLAAADAAGVPLVALHRPQYVTHIQANVGLAARSVGAERRAVELNAAIDAQLDSNRTAASRAGRRPRTVFYSPDGTAFGPYSFASSLISGAGGHNPVPPRGPGRDDAVPLAVEALAALDPDVILLRTQTNGHAAQDAVDALLCDPRLAGVPAVKSGRVHAIDLAAYGGRLRSHQVLTLVADIHRLLYPEFASGAVQARAVRP